MSGNDKVTAVGARIRYADPGELEARDREALLSLPPLGIFRILAHAQSSFRPYLRFAAAILAHQTLDPRLRELAILRVAKLADARYEWVQHVPVAMDAGVTKEQIEALESNAPTTSECFTDIDSAVLEFTTATVASPHVGDATFARLRSHLSEREIVELLLAIGSYLMLARVMTVLELELDPAMGAAVVQSAEGSAQML
jgi:alkylhydroperoxidase family enzyme